MKPPPVPGYRQPDPALRQVSDDELYARLQTSTVVSWEYHHIPIELLRRQNRRTGRRAWSAICISVFALAISLAALLIDMNLIQGDARGTQAEPQ
jgi:hypothetical protein